MAEILTPDTVAAGNICLLYHSIDHPQTDPWGIAVTADNFEQQIKFLAGNFTVISLPELVARVQTGDIVADNVSISFDDGYANNYLAAKPILEKYNCPATFFIATAFVGQQTLFWWDELEAILLHSITLPAQLYLNCTHSISRYNFDDHELSPQQFSLQRQWKWHEPAPTDRCSNFLNIWENLRSLPYAELTKQMAHIKDWAGYTASPDISRLPMNARQLADLSKNPLFTIGLHTHTHADLEDKQKDFQVEEMLACKSKLNNQLNIKTNLLAYPFGRYNTDSLLAVNQVGIKACFTTDATVITRNSNPLLLGRQQVFNGNQYSLKSQLEKLRSRSPSRVIIKSDKRDQS